MTPVTLLQVCKERGIHLEALDGRIRCRGPKGKLSPEFLNDIAIHKTDLLELLRESQSKVAWPAKRLTFSHGDIELNWNGVPLVGPRIALDTETVFLGGDDVSIQRLVIATASNGQRQIVMPPEQVGDFLLAHPEATFVFYNIGFDFPVLLKEVARTHNEAAKKLLWQMAEQGQLRDAMLLDSLLEIATTGEAQKYRSLEEAAEHYRVDLKLDKAGNDHYRKNYAELLGVPLVEVKDRGWFDYAAADALATYKVYEVQQQQVAALLKQNGPFQPGLNQLAHRWGYLTENIQVRAAIALDGPYRKGLTIDPVQREATRQKLRQEIQSAVEAVNTLVKEEAYHGCLPPNKPLYTLTAGGKPSHSTKALRMILEQVVVPALQKQKGIEVKIHRTKTGAISTAAEHWQEFTAVHPLIEHWRRIEEKSKLLQFVQNDAPVIHPRYRTLVSSGRTSCSGPNIQQLPREGAIREMIVPPPGQVFLGSDYATIELRTLASICLNRYGDSRLAEVFDRGEDPHANTAAIMLGMTYEQFLALKSTDEKRFGVERQKAKAINFGVPGGLGAPALIKYAKDTYGVTLTLEEAEALRNRLITEVYPEMGWYLEDDGMAALAWNFHTTPDQLWAELNWVGVGDRPGYVAGFYRRVLRGCKESADGKPYASAMLENVWARLRSVCRNEELRTRLDGNGSDRLLLDCTALPAITATGRIRGRCGFTQVRNTQFQGLAADGAKLALFELAKRGWEIAMFLHDEIIVCVPEGSNYETLGRELVDIMITSMERVVPNVKIAASEAVPMRCWSKAAKRVYDDTP